MSERTPHDPALAAQRAWVAMQGAEDQLARLSGYMRPNKAMREDAARWSERKYEARKELTEQLKLTREAMAKLRAGAVVLLAAVDAELVDADGDMSAPAEQLREILRTLACKPPGES